MIQREELTALRREYPKGTRVCLVQMDDNNERLIHCQ